MRIARQLACRFGLRRYYDKASEIKAKVRFCQNKLVLRFRYYGIVRRIRKYPGSRKIRVMFWVDCTSKWKCQNVYDELFRLKHFDPFVVVGCDSVYDPRLYGADLAQKLAIVNDDIALFEKLGCKTYSGMDEHFNPRPLSDYSPDIVFYQEPRSFYHSQDVSEVMRYALCCYVPYAIEIIGGWREYLYTDKFHSLLFLRVALNDEDRRYVRQHLPWWRTAGSVVGLGHPFVDMFAERCEGSDESKTVIYAPHFAFPITAYKRAITLSSFLENGEQILRYAKDHQEFKWVFKPHPGLRSALIKEAGWSTEKVDHYYREWEAIGTACYSCEYVELFKKATAMITDCGSFSAEFPITGKPLIRLYPKEYDFEVRPAFQNLFTSFYDVHSLEEMYSVFKLVLEEGRDPKRAERLEAVKLAGLLPGGAAQRITDYLLRVCGRKR